MTFLTFYLIIVTPPQLLAHILIAFKTTHKPTLSLTHVSACLLENKGHSTIVRGHSTIVWGHSTIVRGHSTIVWGHSTIVWGHSTIVLGQGVIALLFGVIALL